MHKNLVEAKARVLKRTKPRFNVPSGMKRKWTELQVLMFTELARELRSIRSVLTHPKEPIISDKNRETICHNVAFTAVEYFTTVAGDLFNLTRKNLSCKKKK